VVRPIIVPPGEASHRGNVRSCSFAVKISIMRFAPVTAILSILAAGTAAAQVSVEKVNYKGWSESYRVRNSACELVIVPQVTRVMSFALASGGGGKNVLWENPELAGKTF